MRCQCTLLPKFAKDARRHDTNFGIGALDRSEGRVMNPNGDARRRPWGTATYSSLIPADLAIAMVELTSSRKNVPNSATLIGMGSMPSVLNRACTSGTCNALVI